jgi:hypothetical protein
VDGCGKYGAFPAHYLAVLNGAVTTAAQLFEENSLNALV